MGILLAIFALIVFILADFLIRTIIKTSTEKKQRKEREEALNENLKLDFSHESKTLKRVEVKNPKAKILAVDDEEIILNSFRKILVISGYSVDTVETGQEALSLVQKNNYDFVFTDLKMPAMSGVDVCKSVKHLRPDIDVIIITGYASVDTAVETMKFGAMDYVEKPFTEDELNAMVNKFLIKRQERINKQLKTNVRITNLETGAIPNSVDFSIPGGVFISSGHCWAGINDDGMVNVGIDDFAKKIIGKFDSLEMPELGKHVQEGQLLFSIIQGKSSIPFNAPISGKVAAINTPLADNVDELEKTSYNGNWICQIDASSLDEELGSLKIGQSAVTLFNEDIRQLSEYIKKSVSSTTDESRIPADGHIYMGELEVLKEKDLNTIIDMFFKR